MVLKEIRQTGSKSVFPGHTSRVGMLQRHPGTPDQLPKTFIVSFRTFEPLYVMLTSYSIVNEIKARVSPWYQFSANEH